MSEAHEFLREGQENIRRELADFRREVWGEVGKLRRFQHIQIGAWSVVGALLAVLTTALIRITPQLIDAAEKLASY
jgi:hypothetical protein